MILKLVIILTISILASGLINFFLHKAKKISDATSNIWDDAVTKAAKAPLVTLIWIIAAKFAVDVVGREFYGDIFFQASLATKIAIIACCAWFLLRLINFAAQEIIFAKRTAGIDFDYTTIDAISKLARIIVVIFTVLVIVQDFGFNASGILAAGGAGGLVIGFASKDLFANLLGGLTIYLDRPFNVGDLILCSEKNIEGTVEYIGWRHTRIRTLDKSPLYVPNALFTTVVVENASRMTHRKIEEKIGIRYIDIDRIDDISKSLKSMLDEYEEIDHTQSVVANFNHFGEFSIDLLISAYTATTNYSQYCQIKQELFLKIAKIISKHGAEIAFPTRVVHVENKTKI